jgi:hypothetical protein
VIRRLRWGLVLAAACMHPQVVLVPDTDEGNTCVARCMEPYHSCLERLDREFCVHQRDQCLIVCPGAKLVDNPKD